MIERIYIVVTNGQNADELLTAELFRRQSSAKSQDFRVAGVFTDYSAQYAVNSGNLGQTAETFHNVTFVFERSLTPWSDK